MWCKSVYTYMHFKVDFWTSVNRSGQIAAEAGVTVFTHQTIGLNVIREDVLAAAFVIISRTENILFKFCLQGKMWQMCGLSS